LRVEEGRILGLIGPNGAGKTTALNAILGLDAYEGELRVLGAIRGRSASVERDVSFIAMWRCCQVDSVWQVLDYVEGVHPRFDRAKAEAFLAKTTIKQAEGEGLSKGMVAQLHLACDGIDARLLCWMSRRWLIFVPEAVLDSLLND